MNYSDMFSMHLKICAMKYISSYISLHIDARYL